MRIEDTKTSPNNIVFMKDGWGAEKVEAVLAGFVAGIQRVHIGNKSLLVIPTADNFDLQTLKETHDTFKKRGLGIHAPQLHDTVIGYDNRLYALLSDISSMGEHTVWSLYEEADKTLLANGFEHVKNRIRQDIEKIVRMCSCYPMTDANRRFPFLYLTPGVFVIVQHSLHSAQVMVLNIAPQNIELSWMGRAQEVYNHNMKAADEFYQHLFGESISTAPIIQ